MSRFRLARALVVLVLLLAQGAFGLPHRMVMGQVAPAHAQPAGGTADDCHHAAMPPSHAGGSTSRSNAPMPPCGDCPSSMPGPLGGSCLDMASCGPVSAAPSAAPQSLLAVDVAAEFAPAISAPTAHDFIPEPPPPRA